MFSRVLFLQHLCVMCLVALPLKEIVAQSHQVRIFVFDDVTHEPLDGASVFLNGESFITDAKGETHILYTSNKLNLQVTYIGYAGLDTTVNHSGEIIAIGLQPLSQVLQPLTLYASWATDRSPVTQKTIRKSAIDVAAPLDMPMLLEVMPSSVSTSDAGNGIGYSSLRIRGSDQTRINVMIDGVPVNDAESQNVFWVDLPDLIEDVENVQVQRGIGISTAGPGAFGANINLQTGDLKETMGLSANVGYGSQNSQRYGISAHSGRVGKYFKFKVRGSHVLSDGYIDRAFSKLWAGSFQSQFNKGPLSIAANIYWGKERTYQAWNGVPQQYAFDRTLRTYNSAGLKNDGTYFDDETDNYAQTYSRMIGAYRFNDFSALKVTLYHTHGSGYYNQYRDESLQKYFPEVSLAYNQLVRERHLSNNLLGTNVGYVFNKGAWQNQLGGNAQVYLGKHFGIIKTLEQLEQWEPRQYYNNDATKTEYSAFIKTERSIGKFNLLLDLQARAVNYQYEGTDSDFEPVDNEENLLFFNPKAGLSYSFAQQKGLAYAFAGIGNKEPNRDDFTDAAPGQVPRPERMYNIEMGYRHTVHKWQFGTNVYGMWYDDQLVLTGQLNDVGAYTRVNVDKSYRLGMELEANVRPTNWLKLAANATLSTNKIIGFEEYIDVSVTQGGETEYLDQEVHHRGNTDIAFSPDLTGFARVSFTPFGAYSKLWNGFDVGYNMKYVGTQYLDNSGNVHSKLDAYIRHGIHLNWPMQFGRHTVTLTGQVDNLFNALYINNGWNYRFKSVGYNPVQDDPYVKSEGGNYYSSVGYFPQAERTFFIGLKVNI